MKRRKFFGLSLLAGLGLSSPSLAQGKRAKEAASAVDSDTIDPYFLDSGVVQHAEEESIEAYVEYQQKTMEGLPAILPRGGKPRRAPTFRFLHLNGEFGDPDAGLIGPLSLRPALMPARAYKFNAQILGFNCSTEDWSGNKGGGTLTVEMRGRLYGEAMTWMYVEQFEVVKGGGTSIGLGYVAMRDGVPEPVVCEEPKLAMRIQLIRHKKSPGILRKVLKVGSFLTGMPVAGALGGMGGGGSFSQSKPIVRVPQMAHEGVALAQATIGGMSDEAPIWKSGFNSFALAQGGGRMAIRPGLWIAMDDSPDIDYRSIRAEDMGGRVGLTIDGKPINSNYLVLSVEITPA